MKLFLLIFISYLAFSPLLVRAEEADTSTQSAIGLEPAILEEVLDENNPSVRVINIYNLSNFALPIKTSKQSFNPQDKLNISEDKLQIFDASSWITISPQDTDFILQPKEKKSVTLNIKQPPGASPGGHYATIYFEPLIPAEVVSEKSVYIYSRAAVLVFLQTKGEIVESLKITNVSTSKFSETSSFDLKLSFSNDGNTHLLPAGKVNIYDELKGTLLESIDINKSLILPETEKTISIPVDTKFLMGKISAQFVLTYGANNFVLESEKVNVYIFPYKLIIISLVVLVILFFIRRRIIRAFIVIFGIPLEKKEPKIKLNTNLKPKKNFLKQLITKR